MDYLTQIFICSRWNEFILWELSKFAWIHSPLVGAQVCSQFGCNNRVIQERCHFCMSPSHRLWEPSLLYSCSCPTAHLVTSPLWYKPLILSCTLCCLWFWPPILDHQSKMTFNCPSPLCLQTIYSCNELGFSWDQKLFNFSMSFLHVVNLLIMFLLPL